MWGKQRRKWCFETENKNIVEKNSDFFHFPYFFVGFDQQIPENQGFARKIKQKSRKIKQNLDFSEFVDQNQRKKYGK